MQSPHVKVSFQSFSSHLLPLTLLNLLLLILPLSEFSQTEWWEAETHHPLVTQKPNKKGGLEPPLPAPPTPPPPPEHEQAALLVVGGTWCPPAYSLLASSPYLSLLPALSRGNTLLADAWRWRRPWVALALAVPEASTTPDWSE
ncbi:hypothetical protein H8959_021188 [Pygathrix nigripes]